MHEARHPAGGAGAGRGLAPGSTRRRQQRVNVLGMAGGDGSQAMVGTVAVEMGLPMVVVPAGTRNPSHWISASTTKT